MKTINHSNTTQTIKSPDSRLRQTGEKRFTLEPIKPGDFDDTSPEFGRCASVQRLYGLKRGTVYNLLRDGKIKGVLLRVRGKKSGVRLFDLASVRDFIRSQMDAGAEEKN